MNKTSQKMSLSINRQTFLFSTMQSYRKEKQSWALENAELHMNCLHTQN